MTVGEFEVVEATQIKVGDRIYTAKGDCRNVLAVDPAPQKFRYITITDPKGPWKILTPDELEIRRKVPQTPAKRSS